LFVDECYARAPVVEQETSRSMPDYTLPLLRPLPVFLLIPAEPAAAALKSGRKSRAAAEFCTPCSLIHPTYNVKGLWWVPRIR
jgi:hypothetical protein